MSGGESSKIVVKRTTKQIKAALVIATKRRNLGVRICDERMNNKEKQPRGTQQDNSQRKTTMRGQCENEVRTSNLRPNFSSTLPATDVEEQPAQAENVAQIKEQKKKRGPTRMAVIPLGKKSRLEVSFNLGGTTMWSKFRVFCLISWGLNRAHVPIVMSSWKDLKEKNKDELWSLIQQNYIVGDEHKNFTFRMMGKYWRQFKSKITTAIREASKRKHKARAIALVKPDNVKSKEDWDKFVKERLGAEFQKLNHPNPEEINRVTLWTKAHERKDGTPINKVVSNILPHNKNVEDMISAHACTQSQQGSRHVQDKSYNVNSRCGQSSNLECLDYV
ncbi:uncharacterized protein Pyn_13782 [Prunus yedoensis var. nudiflora]|uniref:Uncharacterized protein n=1 Tax=Prunus yedoensis var. nudiflora TaxID=2094558 RepID=A0A314UJN1_PRUYE|nr:uncharacterized protein Pyn_13782 [Prunus yedoensis var. nudiflora]